VLVVVVVVVIGVQNVSAIWQSSVPAAVGGGHGQVATQGLVIRIHWPATIRHCHLQRPPQG
jgi:hypothetical protein